MFYDDCTAGEREYLGLMIIDLAEVFRHAAKADLPRTRSFTTYETEKSYEFFGTTSFRARAIARQKFDEAARADSGWLNGAVRIYCHAERFKENER